MMALDIEYFSDTMHVLSIAGTTWVLISIYVVPALRKHASIFCVATLAVIQLCFAIAFIAVRGDHVVDDPDRSERMVGFGVVSIFRWLEDGWVILMIIAEAQAAHIVDYANATEDTINDGGKGRLCRCISYCCRGCSTRQSYWWIVGALGTIAFALAMACVRARARVAWGSG